MARSIAFGAQARSGKGLWGRVSGQGVDSRSESALSHDVGVGVGIGIGIGIESQRCSIPIPRATPTPRGSFAPFQGAGIIWDGDPGWASFLGQPGAIGCNAFGVGEWTAGNAGSFAVGLRGGVLVLVLVLEPMGSGDGTEYGSGHVGSSTSTALRAEYEYEYERESRPRSSANPRLSAATPSALESGRPGMRVPSPWISEGGYSYSYSYSS
jgi:hypothetical protein